MLGNPYVRLFQKWGKLQKSDIFSKRFRYRNEHPGGKLSIHVFYMKMMFRGRKETFNLIIFPKNVPSLPHLGINISLKFLGGMRSTFPYFKFWFESFTPNDRKTLWGKRFGARNLKNKQKTSKPHKICCIFTLNFKY